MLLGFLAEILHASTDHVIVVGIVGYDVIITTKIVTARVTGQAIELK